MARISTGILLKEGNMLMSKFRGSLLGGLVGDVTGAPYEGEILEAGDKLTLKNCLDKLEGPLFKSPARQYTDDTAMTKAVAQCLIDHRDLPAKELAGNFVREYYTNPKRGYGNAVVGVFEELRKTKLEDPLGPAKKLFGGSGSYGNGAAMRIAPVGLFCHNKPDKLVELSIKSAEVTHTNRLGINGAILQAKAVNYCVTLNSADEFNSDAFLSSLQDLMKSVENVDDGLGLPQGTEYQNQIQEIKKLLNKEKPSTEEILNKLGHSVSALYSVPTAIYCFVKSLREMDEVKTNNPYRRTIEYAISLGGDTDTIASMAGSICGALYGDSIIAENIIRHCEGHEEIASIAEKLHDASI